MSVAFTFDLLLALLILWLGWATLTAGTLLRAIVMFVAFGLSMGLAWARLDAPDIALAEIAVGAGLTGALLLAAAKGRPASATGKRRIRQLASPGSIVLILFIGLLFAGLAASIMSLPTEATGLSTDVSSALPQSALTNPVNATLLDFRSYDTLLEVAVLLLAVTAIRSISRGQLPPMRKDDDILAFLAHALLPVMILIAGYLFVAGFDSAGGAFQAGAVLTAAGVLMFLSGFRIELARFDAAIRAGLAVGLIAFVSVGVAGMLTGDAFLDMPVQGAGALVMLLEVCVAVSVALALFELFVGVLRRSGDTARREER